MLGIWAIFMLFIVGDVALFQTGHEVTGGLLTLITAVFGCALAVLHYCKVIEEKTGTPVGESVAAVAEKIDDFVSQ